MTDTKTKEKLKGNKKKAVRQTGNPRLLIFKHRKLCKNARDYCHEITHLTIDLLEINMRIQKSRAECEYIIGVIGKKNYINQVAKDEIIKAFQDLSYHVENFAFRLHAYRDKYCNLLNHVLGLGYDDADTSIANHLSKNINVKNNRFDTELKKFQSDTLQLFLSRRKLMSHKIYYNKENYNPMYLPEKDLPFGEKKFTENWKKNIIAEADKTQKVLEKLLRINSNTTNKLTRYLNQKS